MSDNYTSLPGKNEYTELAQKKRILFLESQTQKNLSFAEKTYLNPEDLRGNIESFMGSIEIPLGAAGPLKIKGTDWSEDIIFPMGTTEGALISSVSRGAKALSLAGGAKARFLSQTMTRVPLFVFENLDKALLFSDWLKKHEKEINTGAQKSSRFTKMTSFSPEIFGRFVHLRFFYETGDAAGQNMVTLYTWKVCQKIMELLDGKDFCPLEFYIEGNGSTDKKTSYASILKGRGIKVCAEAKIEDDIFRKVLKVDPDAFVNGYHQSQTSIIFSGFSSGFNVNFANVIAAIFASTGQDLACVGESSQGQLYVERVEGGVYISLLLTNLIIGTVGGGTKVSGQKEILEYLDCYGPGKVKRFAEIIASFCLALDISTLSAIVAGHFAEAHENLGRAR